MKKGTIIAIVIIALVVILGIAMVSGYNTMVTLEADVDAAYSNMDVYMQRRADLIPNLVSTVKGYAAHEQAAIDSVTEARAKLTGATTVEEAAFAAPREAFVITWHLLDSMAHSFTRSDNLNIKIPLIRLCLHHNICFRLHQFCDKVARCDRCI